MTRRIEASFPGHTIGTGNARFTLDGIPVKAHWGRGEPSLLDMTRGTMEQALLSAYTLAVRRELEAREQI